jgi:hypothetical protein
VSALLNLAARSTAILYLSCSSCCGDILSLTKVKLPDKVRAGCERYKRDSCRSVARSEWRKA